MQETTTSTAKHGEHHHRPPIYTIGHGARSLADFLALLQRYEIQYVVDVRSQPYSRFHPHASKKALEKSLPEADIHYVFMGDALGGRPNDETCYVDGKVDYAKLSEKAFYQQGILRLRTAWEKGFRIVLLCAEAKPQECHRSKLIGNTLLEQGIDVLHIDETGAAKRQQEINQLLTGGQQSLFDELPLVAQVGKVGRARKKRPLLAHEEQE